MNQEIFDVCYHEWNKNLKNVKYWKTLGEKFGIDAETLRSRFKRERKKRGIFRENNEVISRFSDMPRVGILDIETLPMKGYMWRMFDQIMDIKQIISETGFLAWAGKYLNEPTIYSDILMSKETSTRDAKRITKSCWNFVNSCDILIGHNLIDFDNKIINTFFLMHDLLPLKHVMVDTLLIARANLKFDSNKMEFINKKLGIKQKIGADYQLWIDCDCGLQKALDKMTAYNQNDVLANEELYYEFRPYIKNVNVALYNEITIPQCPICGNTQLKSEGHYYTSAGKWESLRCPNCKCVSRSKFNKLDKDKKKSLLVNL